ncbi:MAG: AAA family ATPase [Planctomycetota bacterium]|nr:AAA family ATPase [Planctomycetota bacterium]
MINPEDGVSTPNDRNGRIVTFYSYKGGTGRTMALANLAWLLASSGKQVLVIDWDLEAPGLHRYFRPFLDDPELAETRGLIDFFQEFSEGSRVEQNRRRGSTDAGEHWFDEYVDLSRFAVPVDFEFVRGGSIDLIAAGRQGPSYGILVNSMNWNEFYERLGGGVFMEHVKQRLRRDYDFILIDSRTGLSDTAGICTIQMPDDMVVCMTLNRQSIEGAAAVTASADKARRKPTGEPGLRIWPVAMRVELAEKDRLEAARRLFRERLSPYVWQLNRNARAAYWHNMEVLYFPYYAYEEILAPIADSWRSSNTLLAAMQRIGSRIFGIWYSEAGRLDDRRRAELIARFATSTVTVATPSPTGGFTVYLSYCHADFPGLDGWRAVSVLKDEITSMIPSARIFNPREEWTLGGDIRSEVTVGIREADVLLAFVSRVALRSDRCQFEWRLASEMGKVVIPVFLEKDDLLRSRLPSSLESVIGLELIEPFHWESITLQPLVAGLKNLFQRRNASPNYSAGDPDDPQKGRWGGQPFVNGYQLAARVQELDAKWFEIELTVSAPLGNLLEGPVEFHLPPWCGETIRKVVADRVSFVSIKVRSWRAFTVGVRLNKGETCLELDLATDVSMAEYHNFIAS